MCNTQPLIDQNVGLGILKKERKKVTQNKGIPLQNCLQRPQMQVAQPHPPAPLFTRRWL